MLVGVRGGLEGWRTVYLVRHGRTSANELGLVQGWGPAGLSPAGAQAVRASATWWTGRGVELVVSSPMRRALQTAELLFGRVDALSAALCEVALPRAEGMAHTEVSRRWPVVFDHGGWLRPDRTPGEVAESADAVLSRALAGVRHAAASVPGGGVAAAVTHGDVIRTVLGCDRVANLAVAELAVHPDRGWRVVEVHQPLG